MRTKIEAAWIIGFEKGEHRLLPNGALVYEDNPE